MAPGAAIAASIPAGALHWPAARCRCRSLFALVACLLSAWCIGLLARELPSAGSLATYAARGLHPAVGFLVAWGYVLVGWLIPPLVLLQLGFTTASTINSEFHGYPANLWWPWSLAGAVIILVAGFYGIRTSARLGTILGITEIAVFLVLAVFFVVHAGQPNTAAVFTTQLHAEGVPRRLRGDRRVGVLGAGVRRFRGRGAAGRGGTEPAAHHPARGAAGHAAASACCTCSPRTRSTWPSGRRASPASAVRARRPGRAWPARCTGCSGSSCSWPSSTPPSPTPTPA